MKFNWTTQKGANIEIEITVEKVSINKEINADGDKVIVSKKEWQTTLNNLKVNGKEFNGNYNHSTITFDLNGREATIIIPENIKNEIFAPQAAELKAQIEENQKFEAGRKAIYDAMNY
jgi:hypothetical protein